MTNTEPDLPPLPVAASIALGKGDVIEAIKSVRTETGRDLKAAKDLVDRHIARNPVLRDELARRRKELRARVIRRVLWTDAVLVVVFLWWFFGR